MFLAYLKVLKKRNFFFLWSGQVISQFGDRLTQMALIGLVYQIKPFSSISLAKIMSLAIIPVFLISPVAGVYVDRWDKRKTMCFSDFLRGVCILLIPLFFFFHSLIFVYILIFLSFCVGRFFIPAKMAVIPALVSKKDIFMANSLVSTTAMVAAMLGFGLGGVIVERYGIRVAFFIDAATFFVSAAFIYFMKIEEKKKFNPRDIIDLSKEALAIVRRSFVSEVKDGIRYLFRSPQTRYAAKIFFLLFSFIGSVYVVFVVFIQDTLLTITRDLGIIAVASGLGLFAGTMFYGRFGKARDVRRVINSIMLFASAYLVVFVTFLRKYPSPFFAFASCFILGFMVAPVVVAVNSLIHSDSDNNMWGRIFSSLEIVIHLSFILFMFIASYLAEIFSPYVIIVGAGAVFFLFFASSMVVRNDTR